MAQVIDFPLNFRDLIAVNWRAVKIASARVF